MQKLKYASRLDPGWRETGLIYSVTDVLLRCVVCDDMVLDHPGVVWRRESEGDDSHLDFARI